MSIKRTGCFNPYETNWNPSENNMMYVYPLNKVMDNEDIEDIEEGKQQAIYQAFTSAQCTAAIQKSLSDKIIVLCYDIDDDVLEDDSSCENMMTIASSCYLEDIPKIKQVYAAQYSPFMSFVVLAGLIDNEYIKLDGLTNYELEAVKALSKAELYCEELLEFDIVEL
jgi:hypothetical protein